MKKLLCLILLATAFAQAQPSDDIGDFDMSVVNEEVAAAAAAEYEDTAAALFGGGADSPFGQQENYALVMLRVIGYLALVTAIIFVLAWGVRKYGAASVTKVGGGSNMDVIETVYVGQNKGVTLVRVSDAVYLLGHTQENIVLFEKIDGDKAVELIASSKTGSSIVTFKDAFNNFLGKMKK